MIQTSQKLERCESNFIETIDVIISEIHNMIVSKETFCFSPVWWLKTQFPLQSNSCLLSCMTHKGRHAPVLTSWSGIIPVT